MRPFRELRVWRHAHELTLAVYHDRLAPVKRMLQRFIQRLGGPQQPMAKSQQPARSQQP